MRRKSGWTGRTSLYSLLVGQTLGLQIAAIALGLTLPLIAVVPLRLQERVIDDAIPAADVALILQLAAIYVATVLLSAVVKFLVSYTRSWIAEIVSRIIRVAMVEAQRHRKGPTATHTLGTVTSVITGEVEDLGAFAAEALNTPLIEGGTMISLLGFIAYSRTDLAMIGVAAMVFQAVLTPLVQSHINRLTRKRIKALRRAGLDMIEAAVPGRHIQIVEALREIRHTYRLRLRMNLMKALLKVANNLIMNAASIAVLTYGGWLVIKGEMGIGLIVAFLSGLSQISDHWGELLDFYRRYTDARVKYGLVTSALAIDQVPRSA